MTAIPHPKHPTSVGEFLQIVVGEETPDPTRVVLFRGQSDYLPLLPKLFRNPEKLALVVKDESKMLADLRKAAPHLSPSIPPNDWGWMSLGQHYGMPTRMSDWSANPLIALFFAVEFNDISRKLQPVVFRYPIHPDTILQDEASSPFQIKHTTVMEVSHHSHRSAAQAAWQVVHAIHENSFIPLGAMPPHDDRLKPILIDKDAVPALRAELAEWGVTPATVYVEFGWVCRSIAQKYDLA